MARRPVTKECAHCGRKISVEMGEGGHMVWIHEYNLSKYCHTNGPFYVASPKGR